jgi:hypothetical protein
VSDWIDEERDRRSQGIRHAISQEAHAAVNARHPGCTREHCFVCSEETGRAGAAEDSLYGDDDSGPYCVECWRASEWSET